MPYENDRPSARDAAPAPILGLQLTDWQAPLQPAGAALDGMHVRLEALSVADHGEDLQQSLAGPARASLWTWMAGGPFLGREDFLPWLAEFAARPGWVSYALVEPRSGLATGMASYLRIEPAHGSLEIGHLCFGPTLQRSTASTEALYLLLRHAFDGLGYRRCEWKCDQLNAPSRRAAERLGFRFEGVHRQAMVVKGRNRDTAWYSIIDAEWPALRRELERWLAPENFDREGRQRRRLGAVVTAA